MGLRGEQRLLSWAAHRYAARAPSPGPEDRGPRPAAPTRCNARAPARCHVAPDRPRACPPHPGPRTAAPGWPRLRAAMPARLPAAPHCAQGGGRAGAGLRHPGGSRRRLLPGRGDCCQGDGAGGLGGNGVEGGMLQVVLAVVQVGKGCRGAGGAGCADGGAGCAGGRAGGCAGGALEAVLGARREVQGHAGAGSCSLVSTGQLGQPSCMGRPESRPAARPGRPYPLQVQRVVQPNAAVHEQYKPHYQRYKQLYGALAPLYHQAAGKATPPAAAAAASAPAAPAAAAAAAAAGEPPPRPSCRQPPPACAALLALLPIRCRRPNHTTPPRSLPQAPLPPAPPPAPAAASLQATAARAL
jgi:hypothetical protein